MAPKPPIGKGGPRKSNAGTPAPGDADGPYIPTLADKLSYADIPRPFKSPNFTSRLASRTATTAVTNVRKTSKQILVLERERLSGGDGFLSAVHTAAKARGEVIDITKKKTGKPKGNLQNLLKGRLKRSIAAANANAGGSGSGVSTPVTISASAMDSGTSTPNNDEEEEDNEEDDSITMAMDVDVKPETIVLSDPSEPKKEIITYHTPTAPPSLLPSKKYCDITGLHAAYTDPRTKLRYKGLEVWHVVRGLGPGSDQAYLSLRGAQTSLK